MTSLVAIYVGRASQANLQVGLSEGIWGFKRHRPEYDQLAVGDLVLLASGYTGGSPRVKLDGWQQHAVERIELGRLTTGIFTDETQVWPDEADDDVSYPVRFRFERLGSVGPIPLTADGPLGTEVADALRRSGNSQSQGRILTNPAGFVLNVPTAAVVAPPPPPAPATPLSKAGIGEVVDGFGAALGSAGLRMREDLPVRFVCGLLTKPFVILTGLSGSGKTQLAMALGRWLGLDRLHVAAVRPDWTGAEALFGYENMLLPTSEDGRAAWSVPAELRFMLQAADDPTEPHLLLLDEMNLAHVERYFADVLSGMESGAEVLPNLVQDDDGAWRIPPDGPSRLPLPSNLMIVGTVNVDETTYQFSPKVLDRATTIEFRVATGDLVADKPTMGRIPTAPARIRAAFVDRPVQAEVAAELRKQLEDLHELLATNGREFGHRTFQEMLRFAAILGAARPDTSDDTSLDYLLLQKVLPRMHGSVRELAGVMAALLAFVGDRMPLSHDKLRRMQAELDATHFTAF